MVKVIPFRDTKAIPEPMVIQIFSQKLYWNEEIHGWVGDIKSATWFRSQEELPQTVSWQPREGYPSQVLTKRWNQRGKVWEYGEFDSVAAVLQPADTKGQFHFRNISGYPGWIPGNDPVYEVVEREEDRLVIRDIGHKLNMTVTNGVQQVVDELREKGRLPNGRRLFYYDREGQLDEIVVENGKFVRFNAGPKQGNE